MAAFFTVMGGYFGSFSRDTGACAHRRDDGNWVVAFAAGYDHTLNGQGCVVAVDPKHFELNDPEVPWSYICHETLEIPLGSSRRHVMVSGTDLLCRPMMATDGWLLRKARHMLAKQRGEAFGLTHFNEEAERAFDEQLVAEGHILGGPREPFAVGAPCHGGDLPEGDPDLGGQTHVRVCHNAGTRSARSGP